MGCLKLAYYKNKSPLKVVQRSFEVNEKSGAGGYRYGFNGKESDNEVSGTGNQYDYGFRIYNPRIAKFLSVDPLTKSYPWYTAYQFAGNKPIAAIDLDGLEEVIVTYHKQNDGNVVTTIMNGKKLQKSIQVTGSYPMYYNISKEEWLNTRKTLYDSYHKVPNNVFPIGSEDYHEGFIKQQGTLTIDALKKQTITTFDLKSVKRLETGYIVSIIGGVKAWWDLFISPPKEDRGAQEFNKTVKNVLAAASLSFGSTAILRGASGLVSIESFNMAADADQLTGLSDGMENGNTKSVIKTVELGLGLAGLRTDVSDVFNAPSFEYVLQTTTGSCASVGDAVEVINAVNEASED